MKHCPKCSFLYLDSDQICDLDQTPLLNDDFGTDVGVTEHSEPKTQKPPATTAVRKPKPRRKATPKTVLGAVVAGFIIGLMVLLTYQRMRPTSQASQAPTLSRAQIFQAARVAQIATQAANEAAKAGLVPQESEPPGEHDGSASPSVEPSSSTTPKTPPNTRPDSTRTRASSNPVSTGDVTKSGRGPVTIKLADGSTLEADEVWRTKAGIWYRRKGIVTFIKPNRVRAMNH